MPISILCKSNEKSRIYRLRTWIYDNTRKRQHKLESDFEKRKQKPEQKHIFKSHIAVFLLLFVFLYFAQNNEKLLGKVWNPKYNKKHEILTNLHYNCQITGSYNTEECEIWKKKYQKSKFNN
jgi:hypothetical protein